MTAVRPSVRATIAAALVIAAATATAQTAPKPYRFGVVSFYNPRIMYLKYQPLVDYLSAHTGRSWELVIRPTYQSTVDDLCAGDLTMAYLGPLTYVRAHAQCGVIPLIRLQSGGHATYRSVIMVRKDSAFQTLSELAGHRFGFGSPLSTSSHLVPRAMLISAGLRPGATISCTYFEHHERAARAVLLGEVDACGVRDLVGDRFEERGLRILAESDPIPNFPLVVGAGMPVELRNLLIRVLVTLPSLDPVTRGTMSHWDDELASGFALGNDAEYESVRRLAAQVFGPGYLLMTEDQLKHSCEGR